MEFPRVSAALGAPVQEKLAGLPDGAQAQPTVGFSANTASVSEDAGSIDLTLTLSPAQTTDVAVIVKTVTNTASQGDQTGTDVSGRRLSAAIRG